MSARLLGVLLLATSLAPVSLDAQKPATKADQRLALERIGEGVARLEVTSPAFVDGQAIPAKHSDYGEKVSPRVEWRGAPDKTASFVLLMEDPDAADPSPYIHWVIYDIPPTATSIEEARPGVPVLRSLDGAFQGRTSRGNIGYFGPRPPPADAAHHYHVQVFALDATLQLDPGVDRESLLQAMRGHVLAAGEVVGTFDAPTKGR